MVAPTVNNTENILDISGISFENVGEEGEMLLNELIVDNEETVGEDNNNNVENVDIFSPGFASDCLETIEELGIENKENFLKSGGKNYNLIPCLNDSKYFISAISEIILENTAHWNSRFGINIDSDIEKSNEIANRYIANK